MKLKTGLLMQNKQIKTIIWYIEKTRKLQIQCLNINDIRDDRLFWKTVTPVLLIEKNEKSTTDVKIAKNIYTSFVTI